MYQAIYNNKKYTIESTKIYCGHGSGYCKELDNDIYFRISKHCPNQINVSEYQLVDKKEPRHQYSKILFEKKNI
tara:strand:- start:1073 stop:1294 length:222 start_codon:yes stop_codon:yes gene_type:complete